MGKSKEPKKKKFDRNVEISAPMMDPALIKAIHSPPKGERLNLKHAGFKALLSDLNSQDSTDEMIPINNAHIPSYIGISCAVLGYSNYNPYNRNGAEQRLTSSTLQANQSSKTTLNKSRAASPLVTVSRADQKVNHITIDKENVSSPEQERRELTELLTASVSQHRRSPSPSIPPTEDDRHHGTYVGARYCPMPPPSAVVNKHIPLLGIDDDQNPDEAIAAQNNENKVERKIANLYGDEFVEDWRESMTHKTKRELPEDSLPTQQAPQPAPKDLVTLKPTPLPVSAQATESVELDIPTPNVKVLAEVEKQFLNKLLTDDNPPKPLPPPYELMSPPRSPTQVRQRLEQEEQKEPVPPSPTLAPPAPESKSPDSQIEEQPRAQEVSLPTAPEPAQPSSNDHLLIESQFETQSPSLSPPPPPVSGSEALLDDADGPMSILDLNPQPGRGLALREGHIECEVRAESPVDNQSSPVRRSVVHAGPMEATNSGTVTETDTKLDSPCRQPSTPTPASPLSEALVSKDVEPQQHEQQQPEQSTAAPETAECQASNSSSKAGLFYLGLLEQEKSFINSEVARATAVLESPAVDQLDEDIVGQMRSVIGKGNLLVSKKFKQFAELCEANVSGQLCSESGATGGGQEAQFATLNDDLAGFWDMLNLQIDDVRKSFNALWVTLAEISDSRQGAARAAADATEAPLVAETPEVSARGGEAAPLEDAPAGPGAHGSASNEPEVDLVDFTD